MDQNLFFHKSVKYEHNLFKPPLSPLLEKEGKSSETPNASTENIKLALMGDGGESESLVALNLRETLIYLSAVSLEINFLTGSGGGVGLLRKSLRRYVLNISKSIITTDLRVLYNPRGRVESFLFY